MNGKNVKESERLFGADYSERYDEWEKVPWLRHLGKRQLETVLDLLSPEMGDVVVDVGCGTGKYSAVLAGRCRFVVGVDYSVDMITRASRKMRDLGLESKVALVLADGAALPFRDRSFDKGISMNTVQYVPDDGRFISEAGRVCRRKFVLDGICKTELRMVYPVSALKRTVRAKLGKPEKGRYRNFYTPSSLRKKVTECGFRTDRMVGCGLTLPHFYKEGFGVTLPSPYHVLNVIPGAYKPIERIEKRFGSSSPVMNLSTHLIVEIKLD